MRQKRVRALKKEYLGFIKSMSIPEKQQASFWRHLKRMHNESNQPKMKDPRPEIKAKINRTKRRKERKKENAELAAS